MESSNSSLLYERGAMPWFSDHMRIGAGFDARNFQIVRSPFRCASDNTISTRSPAGASVRIDRQVIRDQESLQKYVSTSTRVLASGLPVASMQLSLDCLKSAKCDSNNATVIIYATVNLAPELYQDQMIPLPEASKFLDQECGSDTTVVEKFYENVDVQFGEQERSRLIRRWDISQLHQSQFSIKAASNLEIRNTMTTKNIKERHEICLVGTNPGNLDSRLSTIDLQMAWVDFLQHSQPTPYLALLKPYIDLNIPVPRPSNTHILPPAFEAASELIFALQLSAQAHGMIRARAAVEEVINQSMRVCDVQSWLVLPPSETAASISRLKSVQKKLATIWHDRLMLLETWGSLNLTANDWGWLDWNKGSHTPSWKIGLCSSSVLISIRPEIETHDQRWEVRSKWNDLPECQYGKIIFDLPGRIIVGARVQSLWTHGSNGWFKRVVGGFDRCRLGVEFKTQHYKGGA